MTKKFKRMQLGIEKRKVLNEKIEKKELYEEMKRLS